MRVRIVHIHLSPLDMGTIGTKVLKLKQRSLEWVLWKLGQHKVTQSVEISSGSFNAYILQRIE